MTDNCAGAMSSPVGMWADIATDFSGVTMLGISAGTLSGIEIIVETAVAIGSLFIVKPGAYVVEVLTDEWAEAIIASAPGIGADGLTIATAALGLALAAPSGESFRCC